MEEKNKIPTSKVARASKIIGTGLKVGGNYAAHYTKKIVGKSSDEELEKKNAEVIYDAFSELKGSALKMAQMLSMDEQVLPAAFTEKFQLAQYSAPPLSSPLVTKTFRSELGKSPNELFDSFERSARNAASIGQVHYATKGRKRLAVKIQYPGVANSIESDLKLVKPFALRYLKLKERDIKEYMDEVQTKLLEEANYELELEQSMSIASQCRHIPGVVFPVYYPEWSTKRILTMDWIEGMPLSVFAKEEHLASYRNRIGQHLWDLYMHQFLVLQKMQADPHPGNFLFTSSKELGVIDFGCMKEIPDNFLYDYIQLINPEVQKDREVFQHHLRELDFLYDHDSAEATAFFTNAFLRLIGTLGKPFRSPTFDFGDATFFKEIYDVGMEIGAATEKSGFKSSRGSKHLLYVNRTFYGLFNLLHQLKATINTGNDHLNQLFVA